MSQAPHEASDVPNTGFDEGNHQYPPPSAQNQASHGISNFVDGSGPIFSMYMEMATEEDKKMVENWKADADGILIFTGLFSAAVASLISVSIQDIRPNPQDTSNFYLANIYQTVADLNISTSLPASPPPFSPPNYAVWVNSLWFMSLVISLTCALLATLLQQWARRYLKVTQSRYSPHKRARIRAFFAEGVDKYLLPWVVETLPALLHISLFLFFVGLVVFLCNVNIAIFKLVLPWVGICTALYGCITLMPIFRLDSPYYTSLSSLAWPVVTGIAYVGFHVRWWFYLSFGHRRRRAFRRIRSHYHKLLLQGMKKTAEEAALKPQAEVDTRAFMWTFDCLDEDHELERFFSGLPGFRSSKVVDDPLSGLTAEAKEKLSETLTGFLKRTVSSDLLPEPVKIRRAIICAKALNSADFPEIANAYEGILEDVAFGDRYRGLQTTEFGHIVRSWGNSGNQDIGLLAQATVSYILVREQHRDDSWYILASNELRTPGTVLRDYATHGDSLTFAILIHVTRQQFSHVWKWSWPKITFLKVLEAYSKFNVQDTSPELQHEFCALWNQMVLKAQSDNDGRLAFHTLGPIRKIYISLHQGTDSAPTQFSISTKNRDGILRDPSSYPVCNVSSHIHNHVASTPFARTSLHDNATRAPPPVNPDAHSSSVPAPCHVDKTLTGVSPPHHDIYVPGPSKPAHQTAIENFYIPRTSQDPVTAHVIQGGLDTSTTTTPLSAAEPSTPTLPSTSMPAGAIAIRSIMECRTSSDVLDAPSLPSPIPVFGNMLPTGSHSSSPASTVTSGSHPRLSSAPVLGAGAEGKGSAEATLHKEQDVLGLPLAIRENVMAIPNLPPRSPSPSSVAHVAIAGP